jgi:transposase InsO family protein
LYGVTRAGYYARIKRGVSHRAEQDRDLIGRIRRIFEASRGTYGSPRVLKDLVREGTHVSRRRVARLMGADGMRGRVARIYRQKAKLRHIYTLHPNRLWGRHVRRPDSVWVGDVTYLRVDRHWCYLAMVEDQFTRRILGWSLSRRRGTRLTRRAFDAAYRARNPKRLIFHSDRGIEYAAPGYRERLKGLGVRQSMTSGGAPSENPHAESFFHSLKADVIHGVAFSTDKALRACLRWYVPFYNHRRLHSGLGYQSPREFEQKVA